VCQLLWSEEEHKARFSLGDNRWQGIAEESPNVVRLVISMEGVEGDGEPFTATLPFRLLFDAPMSDVTKPTVCSPEPCTNPVGKFSSQCSFCVVNTDKALDHLALSFNVLMHLGLPANLSLAFMTSPAYG
jgi:hypothetical protein